jgi:hypothetical protein
VLAGALFLSASMYTAQADDGANASLDILQKGAVDAQNRVADRKDAEGNYVMELSNEVLPRALQPMDRVYKNRPVRRWDSKLSVAGKQYEKGLCVIPESIIPFILD